jgi:hypothetical protein
VIKSGSSSHPDDLIPDETTIEIKIAAPTDKTHELLKARNVTVGEDGFFVIDRFKPEDRGELAKECDPDLVFEISHFRMVIAKTVSTWLLITEIGLS